ncbi:MAG: L-seryl-tRNA(Sec) selenium transferase [Desulfovibrio sp.]|uniref:L-seryl-tRNA(Sec) selenium transferase n=1 Tax=Desulfovibrio sp. TaxID=885 RepID=UPI00135E5BCB|nr:L-seryl-tRNA(Sec) selenium transferase [Desulfovibrio sp.]MTJ91648.1 L-seryl-tRNA(Sec) selenium transferase [Desulfovibrio sp.]
MQNLFRAIPSVDASLAALHRAEAALADSQQTPHALLRDLVAAFWDNKRESIRAGACKNGEELRLEHQLPALLEFVQRGLRPRFRSALNATGVVVHTNMGRSVLAEEARQAVIRAATGYCNLELDLATGGRGSRHALVEELICRITGAEAALVVNNNAAAVLLVLDTFCKGGEVVVSRGELVEIGGSFRIPEVMEKSGATLREVGATNRTHLRDYSAAINENTRALMRVHTSNYRIVGFHSAVSLPELSALAHEHGLPLIEDLGSGSLMDFSSCGLPNEPTVPEVLAKGADIATFSGDKVLGGPQAGIITGRKGMIDQLKRNPLTRALRCDKLCLSALEATLRLYLDPEKARQSVPTLRMITCPPAELAKAARSLANKLRKGLNTQETLCEIDVREDVSRVGGGAFPQYDLPTTLVRIRPAGCSLTALKAALLETVPPLIGRLEDDAFCLDPRTLDIREYPDVLRVLRQALDTASRHTR